MPSQIGDTNIIKMKFQEDGWHLHPSPKTQEVFLFSDFISIVNCQTIKVQYTSIVVYTPILALRTSKNALRAHPVLSPLTIPDLK